MNEEIKKVIEAINSVTGTNHSPIYNSHLYWSQKPYNICDILIENLSSKGDKVFDPFMGSGVTLLQCLKNNVDRIPLGVEVNDYPIFLLKSLLQRYDLDEFIAESEEIIEKINSLQFDVYGVVCENCGHTTTLDKSMFEYDENKNKYLTKVFYKCSCTKTTEHKPSLSDVELFQKFSSYTTTEFENINLIPDSRIAVKENQTLFDIFTSRNIKAIDSILQTIKNTKFRDLYLYSLLGILHLSKITDPKSSSQWPLWTPNKDCVEKNVFNLFIKSIGKTKDALLAVDYSLVKNRDLIESFNELERNKCLIIKDGIQYVDNNIIPDESIDLIITDPPYMGQVIYSEYMQLYQPFLKNTIDYDKEIIVIKTKSRSKTEQDYFNDMNLAFMQISRVLKTGKTLCMYFHDANLKIWDKLIKVMEDNDLHLIGITHVNKGKSTLKNIVSPKKSMNGDALLFFTKSKIIKNNDNEVNEEEIINIAKKIIEENDGSATTAKLYDNGVLEYLINNGQLKKCSKKYADLTEIFIKYLNWNEKGYWSL